MFLIISPREKATPAVRIKFTFEKKVFKNSTSQHYPNRMCSQKAAIKIEKFFCIFAKKINI